MNMADKERPSLGDFVRPGSTPAKPATKKEEVTKPPTPTTEEAEEALLAKVDKRAEKTEADRDAEARLAVYENVNQALVPVQDYAKFLKDFDISAEKAEEIVDNILMRGYHEETYALTKKSSVVLRTRAHRDTLRLHAALQLQQPSFENSITEVMIRYQLAASLAAIQGPVNRRFEFPDESTEETEVAKLFDVRMRYIEQMPGALFNKLSIKLALFDRMVSAVMREGVTENF